MEYVYIEFFEIPTRKLLIASRFVTNTKSFIDTNFPVVFNIHKLVLSPQFKPN